MNLSYDPSVDPLRVHIGTRAHFIWSMFWVSILTMFCAAGYLISQLIRPTTAVFTWWAGTWGRLMSVFMGLRLRIHGTENIDRSGPCVFVANHQNAFDIPAVAAVLPIPFGYVAKAELEHSPLLGAALRNSPCVFVDKRDPRRSVASLKTAAAEIREGSSVLIFPSGERSYTGVLGSFKRGAFVLALESGVPIVPVTIVDAAARVDESRWVSRPGTITMVVGDPIDISGMTRRDIPELMKRVREAIGVHLPAQWRGTESHTEPEPISKVGAARTPAT